jgi:transposase-like protein
MLDFRQSLINSTLCKVLKRLHYSLEVMLTCVRWYVAYPFLQRTSSTVLRPDHKSNRAAIFVLNPLSQQNQ